MPPGNIAYPDINGHRYSFASIEAIFNGVPVLGITSINYKEELKAGDVYGTAPQKLGRTRGKQNASCDFEMYRLEWEVFRRTLGKGGDGYGESSFDIQVVYAEPGGPVTMDVIVGVRIEEADASNTEGTDASKVKLTCSCMRVLLGGKSSISAARKVGI